MQNYIFNRPLLIPAIALALTSALHSGEIRGRVIAEHAPAEPPSIVSRTIIQRYAERRPSHAERMGHQAAEALAVVYLIGVPDSSNTSSRPPVVMDQHHEQFIPHVLPIRVGATVRFLNSEEVYHNVFSLSRAKSFNLGRYPKGQYREVIFNKPGVVSIYCDIHTHMNAFILVLPTRHFAATDAEGHFHLDGIPAGTYELRAWHARLPEKSQKVVVSETGVAEVNFVLP